MTDFTREQIEALNAPHIPKGIRITCKPVSLPDCTTCGNNDWRDRAYDDACVPCHAIICNHCGNGRTCPVCKGNGFEKGIENA